MTHAYSDPTAYNLSVGGRGGGTGAGPRTGLRAAVPGASAPYSSTFGGLGPGSEGRGSGVPGGERIAATAANKGTGRGSTASLQLLSHTSTPAALADFP